jgi:uncharacterized protein with GYD domain
MSLNWTDQGIRAIKESPKRSEEPNSSRDTSHARTT